MQTFLPYADFHKSAAILDNKRLGKQRVECKQIYNSLMFGGGWSNHPATLMWKGFENSLLFYGRAICEEWTSRGFKDSLWDYFTLHMADEIDNPLWLGREELHKSHRSNLWMKAPLHYSIFEEKYYIPYWWPTQHGY